MEGKNVQKIQKEYCVTAMSKISPGSIKFKRNDDRNDVEANMKQKNKPKQHLRANKKRKDSEKIV